MAETWNNRIVGYGEEAPDQLLAHPQNFRLHPQHQQEALAGVLSEVGVVQNILVNRTTGRLIDGHLRVALALRQGQPLIPVTYVELSEPEEALILATLDPIAALAGTDAAKLDDLLRDVTTGEAAVQALLSQLAEGAGITAPAESEWADALGGLPTGDRAPFQQMTFTLSDAQAVVVKQALDAAQAAGTFVNTGNANSNGNALARVCEAYLG